MHPLTSEYLANILGIIWNFYSKPVLHHFVPCLWYIFNFQTTIENHLLDFIADHNVQIVVTSSASTLMKSGLTSLPLDLEPHYSNLDNLGIVHGTKALRHAKMHVFYRFGFPKIDFEIREHPRNRCSNW